MDVIGSQNLRDDGFDSLSQAISEGRVPRTFLHRGHLRHERQWPKHDTILDLGLALGCLSFLVVGAKAGLGAAGFFCEEEEETRFHLFFWRSFAFAADLFRGQMV